MSTMTLIQQLRGRAAFLRDKGRIKSPSLMEEAANALEARLAQPAQAVDVGELVEELQMVIDAHKGMRAGDEGSPAMTRRVCREAIRALSVQKAGPVGDGLPLTNTFVQEVPDKCDRIIWRGRYYHLHEGRSPASPAPDKEGA